MDLHGCGRLLLMFFCCFTVCQLPLYSHHGYSRFTFKDSATRSANQSTNPSTSRAFCSFSPVTEIGSRLASNLPNLDIMTLENIVFGSSKLKILQQRNRSYGDKDTTSYVIIGEYLYYFNGVWSPLSCKPRWKVAIIVPYRNRRTQLPRLLLNILRLLMAQKLEFAIFIAEQEEGYLFNRGLTRNVGFLEAEKRGPWDCFIFQDVDTIPVRLNVSYGCNQLPRHLTSRLKEDGYRANHGVGGVMAFSSEHMWISNGFSNCYWGWGGEDLDLMLRLKSLGHSYTQDVENGYFIRYGHKREEKSREMPCLRDHVLERMSTDGINNVEYKAFTNIHLLYYNVSYSVEKGSWNTYEKCLNGSST